MPSVDSWVNERESPSTSSPNTSRVRPSTALLNFNTSPVSVFIRVAACSVAVSVSRNETFKLVTASTWPNSAAAAPAASSPNISINCITDLFSLARFSKALLIPTIDGLVFEVPSFSSLNKTCFSFVPASAPTMPAFAKP